jgi:hypothetical protein
MLADLTTELHDRGIELMIAREVGEVQDVLRHVVDNRVLTNVYPAAAVAVGPAGRS